MFCSKCGNHNGGRARFCRKCGGELEVTLLSPVRPDSTGRSLSNAGPKDPDELTAGGIANVIIGDGFFMVAVILSATHSSVSSLLWLFLLIPAFYCFGRGFGDVLQARQIRRGLKQSEMDGAVGIGELPPRGGSIIDAVRRRTTGELAPVPSITEGTTRDLK